MPSPPLAMFFVWWIEKVDRPSGVTNLEERGMGSTMS